MDELVKHCIEIIRLIDLYYPRQKEYSGIIKKLYKLVCKIRENAENGEIYNKEINWVGLEREFVDDTTDYSSPILTELERIRKIYNEKGLN